MTVAAILPDTAPLDSQIVVDPSDLDRLGVPAGPQGLLTDAATPGVAGRTAGRTALQQLARGHDGLDITVLADERDELDAILNLVLAVAAALLGLTVIIAVVGVGTSTALSVVERTRESSLLRAVGLSRRGLRTMLTAESSLYGLIGATIGVLLGVPYAGLALAALGVRAPLQLPILQLATVTAAMVTLTALAGRLPARKATRISPLATLDADC